MTDEGLHIRPAHIGDTAVIGELFVQLGYPQDAPAATADRIRAWSEDPAGAALVAADADGKVLGVIAVHVCPYFERAGSWGRIVALVVSDRARRQGAGGRLMAAAESFAASRGCVRMEVTSANRREDAQGFYRDRGYVDQTERSSRFLLDLGGRS